MRGADGDMRGSGDDITTHAVMAASMLKGLYQNRSSDIAARRRHERATFLFLAMRARRAAFPYTYARAIEAALISPLPFVRLFTTKRDDVQHRCADIFLSHTRNTGDAIGVDAAIALAGAEGARRRRLSATIDENCASKTGGRRLSFIGRAYILTWDALIVFISMHDWALEIRHARHDADDFRCHRRRHFTQSRCCQ